MQAIEAAPALAPFVVEVLSKAFGRLPDAVLLPWLPKLITTLRSQAPDLVPTLVREAGRTLWRTPEEPSAVAGGPPEVSALLAEHATTAAAVAALLAHPA